MNLRRLYAQAIADTPPKKCNQPLIAFVNHTAKSGKYVTTMSKEAANLLP